MGLEWFGGVNLVGCGDKSVAMVLFKIVPPRTKTSQNTDI